MPSIIFRCMMKCGSSKTVKVRPGRPDGGIRPAHGRPNQQTRSAVGRRLQDERTPVLQDHRARGIEMDDAPAEVPPEQSAEIARLRRPDELAGRLVLPFGADLVGIVHVRQKGTFEPVVAVEPGAILADLRQPGPDRLRRGVDRDPVHQFVRRIADHIVAGQRHELFGDGGAPCPMPRPERRRHADVDHSRDGHGFEEYSAGAPPGSGRRGLSEDGMEVALPGRDERADDDGINRQAPPRRRAPSGYQCDERGREPEVHETHCVGSEHP